MPTIVITGGHSGLGLIASRYISATQIYDIVLLARKHSSANKVARDLASEFSVSVRVIDMDVSSLASTRAASDELLKLLAKREISPVEALILNAGAQFHGPVEFSDEGYEKTFATNCLGHYLLLTELLDAIQPGGRVIFTASGTHDPATADGKLSGGVDRADVNWLAQQGKQGKAIKPSVRYTTSKLCTILYAYELDRQLKAAGRDIASIAYDPGFVVDTDLARTMPRWVQSFARTRFAIWLVRRLGITMGSLDFSGKSLADLAIEEHSRQRSGKYFQANDGRLIERPSSQESYDRALAKRLWRDTENLVRAV